MKRYAVWALIALIAWWIVQDPTSAAHVAHGIGGAFSHAARSLSSFASASSS